MEEPKPKKGKFKPKTNLKKGSYSSSRGKKLRKGTFFPKGVQSRPNPGMREACSSQSRPAVRYEKEYFDVLVHKSDNIEFSMPGPSGEEGRAIPLRPIPTYEHQDSATEDISRGGHKGTCRHS